MPSTWTTKPNATSDPAATRSPRERAITGQPETTAGTSMRVW